MSKKKITVYYRFFAEVRCQVCTDWEDFASWLQQMCAHTGECTILFWSYVE